jgi:hypothetical protein
MSFLQGILNNMKKEAARPLSADEKGSYSAPKPQIIISPQSKQFYLQTRINLLHSGARKAKFSL